MVGGKIIEIVRQLDKTWVNCQDTDTKDQAAIFLVEHPDRCVSIGDDVWWLDQAAFWSTEDGEFKDQRLTKIGNSGAVRPTETRVAQALRQMRELDGMMEKIEWV